VKEREGVQAYPLAWPAGSAQKHADEIARLNGQLAELRAALRTAERQRDHWRRECSDIQERAALSTKAGGSFCALAHPLDDCFCVHCVHECDCEPKAGGA
jgi:hypothetical protein